MQKARGQILVLMAMLTTTLIIFFGMVIAVGHLIQARINLQNSVDLAAMVGASYQARFLNGISVVNYRLRQNYKFVLADLYVTQSRFNEGFKKEVLQGSSGPFDQVPKGANKLVFGICQQYPGYAPNVEIPLGAEDRAFPETDMCKFVGAISGIPHIKWTPVPSLNPFVQANNLANFALSEEIKKTCDGAAGQNEKYFEYIIERLESRNAEQKKLLDDMIAAFSGTFQGDDLMSAGGVADGAIRETFMDNLISANRANPGIKLEYLNSASTRAPPTGTGSNSKDYFEPLESSFTVRSVNFKNEGAECKAEIKTNQSNPIFLGVSRARSGSGSGADEIRGYLPPKIPFFVAIKATLRPNLLFWPRGLTPTLVAVGAAKPFGSRIGPYKKLSNLELTGNENGVGGQSFGNISFYPGDFEGAGSGIYGMGNKRILKSLWNALPGKNTGKTEARPHVGNAEDFTTLAIAPTLYEGLLWSIFPDPPHSSFARGPADTAMYPQEPVMAPILNLGSLSFQGAYQLQDREKGGGSSPGKWHYVNPNFGEDGTYRDGSKPLFYSDWVSVASAFNPQVFPPDKTHVEDFLGGVGGGKDGSLSGRTGYQIKLVSFQQLCKEIQAGDGVDMGKMAPLCKEPYKVWY